MNPAIPESVLEVLRCVDCGELLSCGPVFLVDGTTDAVCGRCSPQPPENEENTPSTSTTETEPRTHCVQYEALAKLHSFPCRYADFGCTELMQFSEAEPNSHERDCQYRTYICPIVARGSCDWINSSHKLLEHCRDVHLEHFLENSSELPRPDITKSYLKNFLISAYNLLFLLHVKICVSSGKLYHSVRMLGNSKFLDKFSYLLEIKANDLNLKKGGSVLPPGIMTLQEPSANSILINSLLDILGGKYNESKFMVTIQTSLSDPDNLISQDGACEVRLPVLRNCVNCDKNIAHVSESKFCEECVKKLVKCKFSEKNCSFVDFNSEKCVKHERYFCEYQTQCYWCGVYFVDGSFIEHLQSSNSCHKTIKSNINSVVRLAQTKYSYNFIIFSSNNIGTIICVCKLSNSYLDLWLFISLPSYALKNFKCSIELTDPQTKHSKILTPQINYNNRYDWIIDEKMDNFPSWQNIGIDIKININ